MAGIWYRAGTVAVTSGSTKVVGTGTTWKNGTSKPDKGHTVWAPDGKAYELDYVESDTVLYLVTAYGGVAASGMAYAIDMTRTGTVSAFARDLSAFVAYNHLQLDGWQKLLTGTGDVTLTAPDGTKITTPSWDKVMNAGYGVVAQAATQAGIATAEAAKAAASADVAADIVAAAALPIPDLWAPLSDSLRLITGYGREVKVGDDVVAKMFGVSRASSATYISKDGKLKAAAANEPRFEKGGLLLEPLSTNFMATQTWTNAASAMAGRVINDDGGSDNIATINYMSGDVGFYETSVSTTYSSVPATIGELSKYVSFEMRLSRALTGNEQLVVYETGVSGTEANHLINSSNCQYFVGKFARKTVMDTPPLPYQFDGTNGLYMYVGVALLSDLEVQIRRVNLESLPEATSYIPTNGAAATRAADRMIGVGPGNIPHLAPFSLAVDISVTPVRGQYPIAISMGGLQVEMSEPVVGQQRIIPVLNGSSNVPRLQGNDLFGGSKVLAISCDSSGMLLRYGGKTSDGNGGQIETIDGIDVSYIGVCHVRNFRIWHRALTDEQIKGVA